jgi:DNA repair exonuclease SbcCD ATPase subunit
LTQALRRYEAARSRNESFLASVKGVFKESPSLGKSAEEENNQRQEVEALKKEIAELEAAIAKANITKAPEAVPKKPIQPEPITDMMSEEPAQTKLTSAEPPEKIMDAPVEIAKRDVVASPGVLAEVESPPIEKKDSEKKKRPEKQVGLESPSEKFSQLLEVLAGSKAEMKGLEDSFKNLKKVEGLIKKIAKSFPEWAKLKTGELRVELAEINAELALGEEDGDVLENKKKQLEYLISFREEIKNVIGGLYSNMAGLMFLDDEGINGSKSLKTLDANQYLESHKGGKASNLLSKYSEIYKGNSLEPVSDEDMGKWTRRMMVALFKGKNVDILKALG